MWKSALETTTNDWFHLIICCVTSWNLAICCVSPPQNMKKQKVMVKYLYCDTLNMNRHTVATQWEPAAFASTRADNATLFNHVFHKTHLKKKKKKTTTEFQRAHFVWSVDALNVSVWMSTFPRISLLLLNLKEFALTRGGEVKEASAWKFTRRHVSPCLR